MKNELEKPMMPGELAAKLGVSGNTITAAKKALGINRTFVFESEILGAMRDPNFCVRPEREGNIWIGIRKCGGKYKATARGSSISAEHKSPEKAVAEVAAQIFQAKGA